MTAKKVVPPAPPVVPAAPAVETELERHQRLHPVTETGFFAGFRHLYAAFSHATSFLRKMFLSLDLLADLPVNTVPKLSAANDKWLDKLVSDASKSDLEQARDAAALKAVTKDTPI
jgi:hypothetical protein